MDQILFIDEAVIKKYTNLDENVSSDIMIPSIITAQDIEIQKTLGTKFYKRLQNGIKNEDLTDKEKELLNDYIAKTLAWYSYTKMLPSVKNRSVDKGLLSGSSEESDGTNLDELQYIVRKSKETAEFYNERLREFLCENSEEFEDYRVPGTEGLYPDKSTAYFSGLYIPGRKRRKDCDCPTGFRPY